MVKSKTLLRAFCLLSTLALTTPAVAELRQLDDASLDGIEGQAGISLAVADASLYHHLGNLTYEATDGGSLSLEGIMVYDGANGPATYSVGAVDANGDGRIDPLTLDAFTVADATSPIFGKSLVRLAAPDWLQEKAYRIESIKVAGYETGLPHELGALDIGPIHLPSYELYVGGHSDGLDFELGVTLAIDEVRLTTNTTGDGLALTGIYLNAMVAGAPEDPATWIGQGHFTVGDVFAGAPATFDVGTTTLADGTQAASVALNLPMAGSLRMENLSLNGTDFGPVAIDGVQVHALEVVFMP